MSNKNKTTVWLWEQKDNEPSLFNYLKEKQDKVDIISVTIIRSQIDNEEVVGQLDPIQAMITVRFKAPKKLKRTKPMVKSSKKPVKGKGELTSFEITNLIEILDNVSSYHKDQSSGDLVVYYSAGTIPDILGDSNTNLDDQKVLVAKLNRLLKRRNNNLINELKNGK
jgi:hypothetical protein